MPHYKLRRCVVCKSYSATFLVKDPGSGKSIYYCYDCWKAIHLNLAPPEAGTAPEVAVDSEKPHDLKDNPGNTL